MNWRRIRKCCFVIAGVGIAGVLIASWFVGGALVAPANCSVGNPPSDFPATGVQIESDSGAVLAGWHLPLPNSKTTAILLHPLRGDRRSMLSRARALQRNGYSTLLVDLQAHGESIGENITVGHLEKHDVRAAVKFVRDTDPNQKIAIIGWSLGGASTVLASPDVDVIVLESVYPTVTEAVHNRIQMRLGFLHHAIAPLLLVQLNPRLAVSPDQLRPIDHVGKIQCPILIASGDCDQHTTFSEMNRMFELANEPKRLVIFNGAGHVDLYDYAPAKYENEVIGYVNEIIGDRFGGHE